MQTEIENISANEGVAFATDVADSTSASHRTLTTIAAFVFIGFSFPAIYAMLLGFPVAHVQDELSYVLAGDTYASGRLTNPTPAFAESFETTHVIIEPSYISKYPPLQGLFLAVGQVVFGHQAAGVWLSCGFFAASLFWMLSGWTDRRWAIIGTTVMIVILGINSYWAQSFWGGMIASAGGALFFGGFRRIIDKVTVGASIGFALGGVVLVNSRPFEGTFTMLPALVYLSIWLLRNRSVSFTDKLRRFLIPSFAVAAIALSMMGYQYYRVTGSPFVMPYSVHHSQYYPAPLFSFQEFNHEATRGNPRIRRVYESYTHPPALDAMLGLGLPDTQFLRSVYGYLYQLLTLPYFLFSPILFALFFLGTPAAIKRDPRLAFVAFNILATFLIVSVGVWWDQLHYLAPIVALMYLLLTCCLKMFYEAVTTVRWQKVTAAIFTAMVIGASIFVNFVAYPQPSLAENYSTDYSELRESILSGRAVDIRLPDRATFLKAEVEKIVAELPEKYVGIVSYSPSFNFHDEIVFNRADLENARMIWAHDLGPEKNEAMLGHYNDRKVFDVYLDGARVTIKPRY